MAFCRLECEYQVTSKHSLANRNTDCLIQIKMELQGLQASDKKTIHLELSMEEFNELFREMEKVANMLAIMH